MDDKARTIVLYNIMRSIEGKLGGGEGVEGLYGSIKRTGFQKILDSLSETCGLNSSSTLVDIGAGIGRPLLHALVLRMVASAFGIEVDSIKCEKAEAFVRQTILELHKRQAGPEEMPEPEVHCADIQQAPTGVCQNSLKRLGKNCQQGTCRPAVTNWVQQVTLLDPATHAYSFWEGVPLPAKLAFGKLFAASATLQGIAVVQRAMRGQDPVIYMARLGFGPLQLKASFPVSMAGSGRSFTAYVFSKDNSQRVLPHTSNHSPAEGSPLLTVQAEARHNGATEATGSPSGATSHEEGNVPAVAPQLPLRPKFRIVVPPPPSARSLRQARRRDKPAEIQSQLSPRKAVAKPARPAGTFFRVRKSAGNPTGAGKGDQSSQACTKVPSRSPSRGEGEYVEQLVELGVQEQSNPSEDCSWTIALGTTPVMSDHDEMWCLRVLVASGAPSWASEHQGQQAMIRQLASRTVLSIARHPSSRISLTSRMRPMQVVPVPSSKTARGSKPATTIGKGLQPVVG